MVGVVYWDWSGGAANNTKWHIPFQIVGGKRDALLRRSIRWSPAT